MHARQAIQSVCRRGAAAVAWHWWTDGSNAYTCQQRWDKEAAQGKAAHKRGPPTAWDMSHHQPPQALLTKEAQRALSALEKM